MPLSNTGTESSCVICYEDFTTEVNSLLAPCPNGRISTSNKHATCIKCTIVLLQTKSKLKTTYPCPICRKEIETLVAIGAMIKSQNKDIKTYEVIETYCREFFHKYLDEVAKYSIYDYMTVNQINVHVTGLARLLNTLNKLNLLLLNNGYASLVQDLLQYSCNQFYMSIDLYRNLQYYFICAILIGNVPLVQQILCAHVFEVSSYTLPLHCAVLSGNMDMIKLLMYPNCINIQNSFGDTPLHLAVYNNRIDIVRLLMTLGNIDLTIRNNYGNTPKDCASIFGYTAIAQLLSDTGS